MKKLYLIFGVVLLTILLAGVVSSAEWDNIKSYDQETKTVTITNWLGLGNDLQKATLNYNSYDCVSNCKAETELTLYNDGILIEDLTFYRLFKNGTKRIEPPRSYALKYYVDIGDVEVKQIETLKNGTTIYSRTVVYNGKNWGWVDYKIGQEVKAGTYKIKLEGTKKIYEVYDWIVTLQGKQIDEWATWGNISLGDQAEVLLIAPVNRSTIAIGTNAYFNATVNITGGDTLKNMSLYTNDGGVWSINATTVFNSSSGGVNYAHLTGQQGSSDGATTVITYQNITMTKEGYLTGIEKNASNTATWGYVMFPNRSVIQNASFGGTNYATFSPSVHLVNGQQYLVGVDNGGGAYTSTFSGEVFPYPATRTFFNYVGANYWYSYENNNERWISIRNINITNSSEQPAPSYYAENFTKVIQGKTLWNVQACDNSSACGFAVANWTILQAPFITILSPTNSSYTTSTIFFNATSDKTISTWTVNYNGTNVTNFPINTSLNVEDGTHHLLLYALDSDGVLALNDSIYFAVDTGPPVFTANAPNITYDLLVNQQNLTLNIFVNDTSNLDTIYYRYNYTQTNVTHGVINNWVINDTIVYQGGINNITLWANDSFGNINQYVYNWTAKVIDFGGSYNTETTEGALESFNNTIRVNSSLSLSDLDLIYNTTRQGGSSATSGLNLILTKNNLAVPNVTQPVNLSFYWSLVLSDSSIINLTARNQTVYNISLDDCSAFTNKLYNFTIIDEELQTNLTDTTLEIAIKVYDASRSTLVINFSGSYPTNPTSICLNRALTPGVVYLVDALIRYESLISANEYYNIVNSSLTSATTLQNITLYDLNLTDSTDFQVTFTGDDYQPVENALIYLQRQYISENAFKTVELPLTDSNGQTILHMVRNNVIYNIIVMKDGVVLATFNNLNAFCEDFTIGDCKINLNSADANTDLFAYTDLGISFNPPFFNETSRDMTFSFTSIDGTSKTVLMNISRNNLFGNSTVCSDTLTSAGGTLTCSISANIDDATLTTYIYVDGNLILIQAVDTDDSNLGEGGFLVLFVMGISFILMFSGSKNGVLFAIILTFVGAISLGMLTGSLFGIGVAGIWLIAIVILAMYKLNKDRPQ